MESFIQTTKLEIPRTLLWKNYSEFTLDMFWALHKLFYKQAYNINANIMISHIIGTKHEISCGLYNNDR